MNTMQLRWAWMLVLMLVPMHRQSRGQVDFVANLDATQVIANPSSSTATGQATMRLNANHTELAYSLSLEGLDLEPDPSLRVDDNDVVGIHIHLHVADVNGPHILNIFGNPSEDDGDLVVDYENETLSGVFDQSDASRDPVTGDLLPQSFPLTTKLFPTSFRLAELLNEEWYFAVHTVGNQATPPGVTLRGNFRIVPEPSSTATWLFFAWLLVSHRNGWRAAFRGACFRGAR